MNLADFAGWNKDTKRAPRGAIARIADHLGVHHEIVKRYLTGEWAISKRMQPKIDKMIRRGISLKHRHGKKIRSQRAGV